MVHFLGACLLCLCVRVCAYGFNAFVELVCDLLRECCRVSFTCVLCCVCACVFCDKFVDACVGASCL